LFGRTTTWLSVADLAVFWLSGAKATDYSLASRTMAFDQERLTWATPLLSDVGLSADLMPEARQGGTVVGHVLPDVARRTGLPAGISVVLGGHDRLSGAFAARAGTSSIVDSVGTAEAVVVVTSREQPASRAAREQHTPRYCDVTPGRMAYSARVGLAGGLVEWARRELFSPVGGPLADYDDMLAELPADGGFTGVVCYPSFGRAIKPSTQDDLVQGAFMGVTASHGRGELLQSCLEASAFSLRSNLDALALDTHTVRVEGGAVRNARWMQIRADVTGRRLESVEADHVAAVGAALLAGVGADVYPSHDAAAAAVRPRTRTWLPDPHRSSRYDEVYRTVYQRLPDAIAPVNRALNALTHEQIERNAHGS
jgi:xylulokinase